MTSIHEKGRDAIKAFKALGWPEGVTISPGPAAGRSARRIPDCEVAFEAGARIPVEIKKLTTSAAQMRPLDYRTTVVWRAGEPGGDGWWVIPAHDVVKMALCYVGQHCTNSFECFNPGKPTRKWDGWKCESSAVPGRVLAAFEASEKSPLKGVVVRIRADIEQQYGRHKLLVLAEVHSPGCSR